jgi:hypothetical protein
MEASKQREQGNWEMLDCKKEMLVCKKQKMGCAKELLVCMKELLVRKKDVLENNRVKKLVKKLVMK